jgi:hypothetical protein
MAKHNISMGEIEVNQPIQKTLANQEGTEFRKLKWWEKTLASILAKNFRCNTYTNIRSGKSRVMFYGLQEDVELVKEAYLFAVNQIKFLSDHYIKSNGISGRALINSTKNDYINGFLNGLRDMFSEQVKKNGWGLVLVQDALVVQGYQELSQRFGKARSSRVNLAGNSDARGQGYSDGRNFNNGRNALTC